MDGSTEFTRGPSEWWDRLDCLVEEASALPAPARGGFLQRACPDDPALRAEAASLLTHLAAGDELLSAVAPSLLQRQQAAVESAAAPCDPLIGRNLHQYRIEARLGSGGMGVVYRALDTRLDRPVALKFIRPGLRPGPRGKNGLLVEARSAAALDHPNICTIYEVGEAPSGSLFIAMAYYEGETLKARLSRRPFSVEEALDVVLQVAEGVKAAHARGIVHRDIKPGNVMITQEGVAKLLDFGIAQHHEASLGGPEAMAGTAAYMAPEQFHGGPGDSRSDVWALGVTAYELLTSRRPFGGDTPAQTTHSVLNDDPAPLADGGRNIPGAVQAAVIRALAKDPSQRQQSVAELMAELSERVAGSGRARPVLNTRVPSVILVPGRLRPRKRALAMAGVGVLLVTSSAGVFRVFDAPGAQLAEAASLAPALEPAPVTVAVLFDAPTSGNDQLWFADGIAGAIQEQLARIRGVRVVGHFSTAVVLGDRVDASDFRTDVGARYLLTGNAWKRGDSISVSPQLIDAATGERLWEAWYGGSLSPAEVARIPARIAREAGQALDLRYAPSEPPAKGFPDETAYQAYLEGKYHLRRFQSGVAMQQVELDQSVAHLRQTVAHDPSWAPGLSALGEALSWVGMFESELGELTPTFAEAKRILERALELDPDDARAYATLGYVVHRSELDFTRSEALFERALELDPNQYWHCGYAYFLLWAGRYDEAARAFRQAEAQDPLYLVLKGFLIASNLCSGRYAEAIATAEEVLAVLPQWASIRRNLVLALQASGREGEAFARIDASPNARHPYNNLLRALLHARAGRVQQAEDLIRGLDESTLTEQLRSAFPTRELSPAPLYAAVLVAVGRREDAIALLQRALDRDPDVLLYDRCYPELKGLEDDFRYRELLRRTGVPL